MDPHPLLVSPLGGAKDFFSNAFFSVTAARIETVLSPLCAPRGCPYSAPTHWGPGPPIWGTGSPQPKFHFFDPEIFWGPALQPNFPDHKRVAVPLDGENMKKIVIYSFRDIWSQNFWGRGTFSI